jgi:hypothetical protein
MQKLLKRWYIWLGLVLLLGLAASMALILANANASRITQANYDRIQDGMSLAEVQAILGKYESWGSIEDGDGIRLEIALWAHGPNRIVVGFWNGGADEKNMHLATASETLQWYAKKGAAKIGVKWD